MRSNKTVSRVEARARVRRLTTLALIVSFAMVLAFVEARLPEFAPGVKIGLANIAIIFALYKMGAKEAIIVSFVRIVLVSMLFGHMQKFFFSLAGAVLSLAVMIILKKLTRAPEMVVSIAGGIMHNVGQIIAAIVFLGSFAVAYYLPLLLLSGSVAGVVVGVASALLIKKVDIDKITKKSRR